MRRRRRLKEAEALAQLKELSLGNTRMTDAGCAHLASRMRSGALPALECIILDEVFVFSSHFWD